MSYDMHGTWDQNNTWVGPFLNPHMNLTEIKGALDQLWRNDIELAKVMMGLAYYGRNFTLSSPDCFEPGCTYKSGGNAGQCSSTVRFLLNSEIQTIISENGLTPKFYEEDAVKVIHWGDQWVLYDDADTFKIRGDFVNSQCLGGVMVWAISHDDHKLTSAEGLMTGLGKK
jgi:GH18 family chitinase